MPFHTSNVTEPALPTSSSTPMVACSRHGLSSTYRTSLAAWTPIPLLWGTPPMVIGTPSPAAVEPFDRSRSYGPKPFTGVPNGVRSDRNATPKGGGVGGSLPTAIRRTCPAMIET